MKKANQFQDIVGFKGCAPAGDTFKSLKTICAELRGKIEQYLKRRLSITIVKRAKALMGM